MKTLPLIVKPILTYSEYEKAVLTSWRAWGAITSKALVEEEISRIRSELSALKTSTNFPIEFLDVDVVSSTRDLVSIEEDVLKSDIVVLYAAGGDTALLNEVAKRKRIVVFIRWKTGPYYLWHEIIDARLIRMNTSDVPVNPWIKREDVVVDDYNALKSKLRALYAIKNLKGRRILCIGGAWGWEIGYHAAANAVKIWSLDLVIVPYSELEAEVKHVEEKERDVVTSIMREYLDRGELEIKVPVSSVYRGFILYKAIKNLALKYNADVVTSPGCMTTVIQIAKTPPCLPYSILNDEDVLGVCEGDFVAIPVFILLRLISGKPVFFANPTLPREGEVLVAHCTAPRKMSGNGLLPAELYTHFESDEGVAVRVLMSKGQEVTVVNPGFDGRTWTVFKGEVIETPFYPACRTQVVLRIHGDWVKLKNSMRGFHWLIACGDYVDAIREVAREVGVEVVSI